MVDAVGQVVPKWNRDLTRETPVHQTPVPQEVQSGCAEDVWGPASWVVVLMAVGMAA